MTQAIDLRVANLIIARVCHDLIGPVAAIGNGAELLTEDDPSFVREAAALVGDSARKASRRLQFFRFAYGFSGGGLSGPPPHLLAAEFCAEANIECDYAAAARALPIDQQQLACAMLVLAAEGLPRGGQAAVAAARHGPEITATGAGGGLSADSRAAATLSGPVAALTSRSIAAYFAGLLAAAQGCRLVVADQPGGFRLGLQAAT